VQNSAEIFYRVFIVMNFIQRLKTCRDIEDCVKMLQTGLLGFSINLLAFYTYAVSLNG